MFHETSSHEKLVTHFVVLLGFLKSNCYNECQLPEVHIGEDKEVQLAVTEIPVIKWYQSIFMPDERKDIKFPTPST